MRGVSFRQYPRTPPATMCAIALLFRVVSLIAGASCIARAADFVVGKEPDYEVTISGAIRPGDFRKLAELINPYKEGTDKNYAVFLATGVRLNSRGGDVSEALRIATLVEKSFIYTAVANGGVCLSSCVLIWAAGVHRFSWRDRVGVHRLRIPNSNRDINLYGKSLTAPTDAVRTFLERQGIPTKIIDKLNETPSSDVFYLTNEWLDREGLGYAIDYRPAFYDLAEQHCGQNPLGAKYWKGGPDPGQDAVNRFINCERQLMLENQRREGRAGRLMIKDALE